MILCIVFVLFVIDFGFFVVWQIDVKIVVFDDWCGEVLVCICMIIYVVDLQVVEIVKWWGVLVWEYDGILCIGEIYMLVVKMIFVKGVLLLDLVGLFNVSLDGNMCCVIDVYEGDMFNVMVLKVLICVVVVLNVLKMCVLVKKVVVWLVWKVVRKV